MNQYCRYCSHMYCGNGNYCEVNECTFSDSIIKHTNKCRCFDFIPIDALFENDKGYQPRKGHYISEKPDQLYLDFLAKCGELIDPLQGDADMNYCPNCGAKMNKEEQEHE